MNWFQIGFIAATIIFYTIITIRSMMIANKLRYKIAEAYQIVGSLADEAGCFDDPAVIKALDHFADPDKFLDDDLLPWYLKTKSND